MGPVGGDLRATVPGPVWLSLADLNVIADALAEAVPPRRHRAAWSRAARRVARAQKRRLRKARRR